MLYWLWPNSGHMTDTGECKGQRGCLAPEVRRRKLPPPSLKITQAPCVQSVGTETHWGFLPATVGNLYPNLNHNRPMKELLQQKQSYKTVIGHSVCPNKINLFSKHHSSQYHKKLDHTPLSFTHMPELLTSPFFLFVLSLCVLDCALFLWSLIVNCIKSIKY